MGPYLAICIRNCIVSTEEVKKHIHPEHYKVEDGKEYLDVEGILKDPDWAMKDIDWTSNEIFEKILEVMGADGDTYYLLGGTIRNDKEGVIYGRRGTVLVSRAASENLARWRESGEMAKFQDSILENISKASKPAT